MLADPQGRWQWRAQAARIHLEGQAKRAHLAQVTCSFSQRGREALRAGADQAVVHLGEKRVILEGRARCEWMGPSAQAAGKGLNLQAGRLQADRIEWDLRTQQVRGEGGVRFTTPQVTVTGGRFWADTELRHVKVTD